MIEAYLSHKGDRYHYSLSMQTFTIKISETQNYHKITVILREYESNKT